VATNAPGAPSATASGGTQPSATPPTLPTVTGAAATTPATPANSATAIAQATAAVATGAAAASATAVVVAAASATPLGTPANSATAIARVTAAAAATATSASGAGSPPGTSPGAGQPTATSGHGGGPARARITLNPTSVHAGGRVVVTGGGFRAGEIVTLSLNGEALDTGTILVGRDGHFTAAFTAPNSLLRGANAVGALGLSGDGAVATLTGIVSVASQYYIAGGVNVVSEQSSLAVLNPSGRRATLRLTFYYAHGGTRQRTLSIAAHAASVTAIGALRLPAGDFGLSLIADQRVAAQLDIIRPGRDGDSLLGNTGTGQTWYLAEGYTGLTFHETVAILNPGARAARVHMQLLPFGGRRGRTVTVAVAARSHVVVDVNRLLPGQSLSVVARSSEPVVVARTLRFSAVERGGKRDYGETTRAGGAVAAASWLLAEGTTVNHFQTFLTILNPGDRRAGVTASFYGSTGRMLGKRSMVMAPRSRANVKLNDVVNASGIASMVASSQPVIVERPEYFGSPNAPRVAGSDVFGRNGVAQRWTFPGGDTKGLSEFYLLYNPTVRAEHVRVTLYSDTGRVATRVVSVSAGARGTFDAGRLFPGFPGTHGATLQSLDGVGFVAERTVFASNRSTLQSTQGPAQ